MCHSSPPATGAPVVEGREGFVNRHYDSCSKFNDLRKFRSVELVVFLVCHKSIGKMIWSKKIFMF